MTIQYNIMAIECRMKFINKIKMKTIKFIEDKTFPVGVGQL